MAIALVLAGFATVLGSVGLFIYMFFATGRRKKVLGLSVLAFVVGVVLLGFGGMKEKEQESIERGFASVNDMRRAEILGFETGAQYQAHLDAEKAKADEEARVAAEAAAEEARLLAEAEERKAAECPKDLRCWAEKHSTDAEIRCDDLVEDLAKFDFEWAQGFLGSKFSRYLWKDADAGIVTYLGDEIKFQNGFGAWQRYKYACNYDTVSGRALFAEASPGRL